jgi:hypothetical protein
MRARLRYVLPLAGLLFVAPVQAASPPSERQPTLEEVKQADKELEDWKKKDPTQYTMMVAVIQQVLGSLGYGTGPFDGVLDTKTREALQRYQRARQLPVTGTIDSSTVHAVFDDDKLLAAPPSLPPLSVITNSWDKGYVRATGTWIIVGERQAFPIQTSEITCWKPDGTCRETTAQLSDGNFLSIHSTLHDIERWDRHEIVTKPQESALCARYTLRITRQAETVTGLRLRTLNEGMCKGTTPELHLKLVSGVDVWLKVNNERNDKLQQVRQMPGLDKLLVPKDGSR